MPSPPPGFPPLDPNNPLSALLAMAAMGFTNLPGLPQFNTSQPPSEYQQDSQHPMPPKKPGQRCRDYDVKGYCALGSSCPYEHGENAISMPRPTQPDEYDPTNAALTNAPNDHSPPRPFIRGRGRGDRGRNNSQPIRGGRAAFSMAGPNHDHSKTSIVVEQIPEEKFTEEAVRGFFGEYGNIVEVNMQPYKRLAIVKYDNYFSARNAYQSPKSIFDNRFVKVYWYKPEHEQVPSASAVGGSTTAGGRSSKSEEANKIQGASGDGGDEEMLDIADFTAKQAEAQKAHEEKLRKLKEAEAQKEELAKKQREQAEERRKLVEQLRLKEQTKLADRAPGEEAPQSNGSGNDAPADTTRSTTDALKAKLAELEAEAASMGLNPDEPEPEPWSTAYRGRGRGGHRGRGGFSPRGRGFDPYRGGYGYRGRGNPYSTAGGGVMRLDNRPRRVSVSLADGEEAWSGAADEALRLYLMVRTVDDIFQTDLAC